MTEFEQGILDKIRNILGTEELDGAIVYLNWNQIRPDERVHVGDAILVAPWVAYIAFVDLEPRANWGHACYYLAISRDSDDIIKVAAHMPPFLKEETSTYSLLWRGPLVPEWAVATHSN